MKRYKLAVAGGTFDHLHKGHRAFLEAIFLITEHCLLGITNDSYSADHKAATGAIESYALRSRSVRDFLRQLGAEQRVTILPISSTYGPDEWRNLPIEAIIVTDDTAAGAEAVNQARHEQGQSTLAVVRVEIVLSQLGEKISSRDIRAGLIDTDGNTLIRQP